MKNRWRCVLSQSAAALLALAAACGSNKSNNTTTLPDGGTTTTPPGGVAGSGNLTTSTAVANGSSFALPLDSAPSPDGASIYFTGVDPATGAAVFKVSAVAGSTPTLLTSGCASATCDFAIGAPLGVAVASDGSKVYVADPAYAGGAADTGFIFSVPSAGGGQTPLTETAGYNARSITVAKVGGSDNLYFIGDDKTDGTQGIFKDASGAVTTVLKGGDPQAVAAATDGTVYFVDGSGNVQKLAAGGTAATALGGSAKGLAISFPAALALSADEKFLLVPVTDPATSHQSIARIDAASGAVTQLALTLPSTNSEAGGLHRAANADVYSFVDTGAGSSGTIYVLK